MSITYKELKTRLRKAIWVAPGESANLKVAHDLMFREAMVEIGKWCLLNRENNTTVINACSTLVQCGLTVFDGPLGEYKRIYTIANDDWCDKVYYGKKSYQDIQCWIKGVVECLNWTAPENVGLPALQQGFRYAEASTDSPGGRARGGYWALDRRKVYIGPWVQSNEKVIIEWDGWKQDWADDDVIDEEIWGVDVQAAIKSYVKWRHEMDFGDVNMVLIRKEDWDSKLADLMYWDKRKREQREAEGTCSQTNLPPQAELDDDAAPAQPGATLFSILGDFGRVTTGRDSVAAMVVGWQPEFIITTGDNWYDNSLSKTDLDLRVGQPYHSFIGNYQGTYGAGATRQNFYPTIGNHDRDPVGRLSVEMDWFGFAQHQTPGEDIRPFYTFTRGPVQVFVLDGGFDNNQTNQQTQYGNTATSAQAEWLRVALLVSIARWKIVVVHQPPYTSFYAADEGDPSLSGDGFLAYPALRWPFKQWGADVVVSGHIHSYERLEVDGFPYIVNGAGGVNLAGIFTGDPNENSLVRYDGNFGAQRVTADCENLQMDFYSIDGVVRDSFKLTKSV